MSLQRVQLAVSSEPETPAAAREILSRWVTPARIAELLGLTRNTVYQLIRRGEIPAIKIGGRQFVDADELVGRMGRGATRSTSSQAP